MLLNYRGAVKNIKFYINDNFLIKELLLNVILITASVIYACFWDGALMHISGIISILLLINFALVYKDSKNALEAFFETINFSQILEEKRECINIVLASSEFTKREIIS